MWSIVLGVAICAVAALAVASSAQAKTTMNASCFYESGQNGDKKISDYTIWNTASVPIPKGTVITYVVAGKKLHGDRAQGHRAAGFLLQRWHGAERCVQRVLVQVSVAIARRRSPSDRE